MNYETMILSITDKIIDSIDMEKQGFSILNKQDLSIFNMCTNVIKNSELFSKENIRSIEQLYNYNLIKF